MARTTGKLAGRAALITGGGTGIGRGIALRFVREGAAVALCGRREGPLAGACAEIESAGGRCVVLQGDIGVEADVRRIVAGAAAALGGLDVLVNNASVVGQVGPVEELDLRRWNAALAVNLGGAMLCCREAIPHLKRGGGTIVNISSNVGRRGFRNRAPYVCAKWALHGLTQTLALELAGSGVRVNAVCPRAGADRAPARFHGGDGRGAWPHQCRGAARVGGGVTDGPLRDHRGVCSGHPVPGV